MIFRKTRAWCNEKQRRAFPFNFRFSFPTHLNKIQHILCEKKLFSFNALILGFSYGHLKRSSTMNLTIFDYICKQERLKVETKKEESMSDDFKNSNGAKQEV